MCSCFIIERRLCCARVGNDVMSRCCLHVTRFMLLGFCLHHKIIKHIFFHWWRWFYDWKTFSSSSLFLGNLWWKFDDTCRLYDEQKLQKLTHLVLFCLHFARWKGSSGRGKLYESSETCAIVLSLGSQWFPVIVPKTQTVPFCSLNRFVVHSWKCSLSLTICCILIQSKGIF